MIRTRTRATRRARCLGPNCTRRCPRGGNVCSLRCARRAAAEL